MSIPMDTNMVNSGSEQSTGFQRGMSNSSSGESTQDQCWSVIGNSSDGNNLNSPQRNLSHLSAAHNTIPSFSFQQFGSLPNITHITNRNHSSYINNHFLVQRAVMNTIGQHFTNVANGPGGGQSPTSSQHQMSNLVNFSHYSSPQNRVQGEAAMQSFTCKSSTSGSSSSSSSSRSPRKEGSSSSGNSSGSESDEGRSIEFTGPDGYDGSSEREGSNSGSQPPTRLPFSVEPNDSQVSELWLELPNLEFVCKYCFLSPCYCFGDRKQ